MNIIEQGQQFVEYLRTLAQRSAWEWCHCPRCGGTWTHKNGGYHRRPWTPEGRQDVRIQRHWCSVCGKSYSETKPWLVRGSWYAREVQRQAVDWWVHGRSTLRRTAEMVRSTLGRQERWWTWHVWEEPCARPEVCRLSASTLQRWLARAGKRARGSGAGQLEGIATSGQMGADGLWARLRRGSQGVLLSLSDSVSGVVWAVVVVADESVAAWRQLFERAKEAGLDWQKLNGLTSDGAQGLLSYLREAFSWVHHQHCVWHFWRSLATELARAVEQAVQELGEGVAFAAARAATAQATRQELTALLHAIIDAQDFDQAEQALARLAGHPLGHRLAQKVNEQLHRLLFHLLDSHRGLVRVAPEWLWRDFRLRPSRGRNHGSTAGLERAALLWQIYHNLTPAQRRSERKRTYKHPGQSPLEVAGSPPQGISYLDVLQV
jgi:transposase-like protein